jgi:hypothetical protein
MATESPPPPDERRRRERTLAPYRRHLTEWRRFFVWVKRHRTALVEEVEFYGLNFHRAMEAYVVAPEGDCAYFLGQLDLLMRVMDGVKVRLLEAIIDPESPSRQVPR